MEIKLQAKDLHLDIIAVTTLTELPKLKDVIFGIDPGAFVVVNNTLEVLGKRHGSRKVY
jgi:uncharacterized membrane-anchored protein YitT (DUF2179 family)